MNFQALIEPLPDIPRLYTALAEWFACLVVLLPQKKRLTEVRFVLVSLAAFVLIFFYIKICTALKTADCLCLGIRVFIIAEFAASLEWQLNCFIFSYQKYSPYIPAGLTLPLAQIALLGIVFGVIFAVIWVLERSLRTDFIFAVSDKETVLAVIIGGSVFALSNLSFVTGDTPFSGSHGYEIMNLRT